MEILGKVKELFEVQTFKNGFKKRELVVRTNEKYPQTILVEFIQDKIKLLKEVKLDDNVKISVNLRGREWRNQNGIIKYINSIQGWKLEKINNDTNKNLKNKKNDYMSEDELVNINF